MEITRNYRTFDLLGDEKKKRPYISKLGWEAIKKRYKNKCILCGKTEKQVGKLQKAHLKVHSKGGSQVVPKCPNCHTKYDAGLATDTELKKLGIDKKVYHRMMPKKTKKKEKDLFKLPKLSDPFDSSSKRGRKKSSSKKSKGKSGKKSRKRGSNSFGFDLF